MEDVWKELSLGLTSLDNHYSTAATAVPPPDCRMSLQEFLATPLDNINTCSSNPRVLEKPQKKKPIVVNNTSTSTTGTEHRKTPFCHPTSDANLCACSKRKGGPSGDGNGTDLKKYKLMKNRESAARSRARKQAYTGELEVELEHLMAENSELRKQQQLCAAAAAIGDEPPKKNKLQRTLTAPF